MSTALRGMAILRDPLLNKSTAFPESEREALGSLLAAGTFTCSIL
jgi:hypothetical protein